VIPVNYGQILFKFLDMPVTILNFTSAGVYLSSETHIFPLKICHIVTIRSKFE